MAISIGDRLDLERLIEGLLPPRARRGWERLDSLVAGFMRAHGITLLRLAVGMVFIWFGALKVVDRSPVADLVADTVYWLPSGFFVRFLGVWEIAVGLGLLLPVALRLTLLLFWAQMAGTFLVLVIHPGLSFQSSNPLLLTITGEFVIKNLVLITAGLVIGSTVRRRPPTLASAEHM
ncbi:MAG: hypothetical protein ACE5IZ_10190 [Dehalococcoidia bacterium]